MKYRFPVLIIVCLVSWLLPNCKKQVPEEVHPPSLYITLKNDTGKSVAGVTVKLYKTNIDSSIVKVSDSTGVVIFYGLDTAEYHWLATKGCQTNLTSQTTLNRKLIPNVILYGYSVIAETGALKIINTAPEAYKVSDSLFSITVNKDTPVIAHRRVRSYLIHSSKISTPTIIKDTLIKIRCGDTTVLRLPY